jgi:uncharacterized protein YndB with AHSA1/START domain
MSEVATIAPVRKSIAVACSPERAFEVFTGEVATWWPTAQHSIYGDKVTDVVMEPRVGGELYEVTASGERAHWARVLEWDPPKRLVLAWKVNPETDRPTEIEVTFTPEGAGTRVDLEHRNWEEAGAAGARMRDNYQSGWDEVLAPFVEQAV